jgi:CheY-like chemotaxis protein
MHTAAAPLPQRHLNPHNPTIVLWRAASYHACTDMAVPVTGQGKRMAETDKMFTSALIMARHEDHAVIDRQLLRNAGIRSVRVLTSGADAARKLSENKSSPETWPFPDIILCDSQLADMSGHEFTLLARMHPDLQNLSIVMAANDDSPELRRKAKEADYSGLLFRPYSLDKLVKQLEIVALHKKQADLRQKNICDARLFEQELARYEEINRENAQSAKALDIAAKKRPEASGQTGFGAAAIPARHKTNAPKVARFGEDDFFEQDEDNFFYDENRVPLLEEQPQGESASTFSRLRDAVQVARVTIGLYGKIKK